MTKWLRFRDLQKRGIANSWAQLGNLIRNQGFPPGRMLGPNTRAWEEETEIEPWEAGRPVAGPQPRGAAKAGRGRPRKAEARTETAANL
jgi:predicted DNA-binding transcriptional regulator AlpA